MGDTLLDPWPKLTQPCQTGASFVPSSRNPFLPVSSHVCYLIHWPGRLPQTHDCSLLQVLSVYAQVYLPRLPQPGAVSRIKKVNYDMSMWQRGYIRERLTLKCREQCVKLAEVPGKDISRECSSCGAQGSRKEGVFFCPQCGYTGDGGENTARNVKKRGIASTPGS